MGISSDIRTALVTGATSGIGKATARELARRGIGVMVMSRDRTAGEKVVDEIRRATGNGGVELLVCDLSSPGSVRDAAADFKRRFERLHILINGAAVFVNRRILTENKMELMFATNHLGPFLLTNLLLERLEAGAPARIINVTAPSAMKPDFNDLQSERNFGSVAAFGRSKADNLLFTFALARRLKGTGTTVNAFHPGVVRNTNLMRNAPGILRVIMRLAGPFLRTPERVANDLADLALSGEFDQVSGKLIHDGAAMASPLEKETAIQELLWEESLKLTANSNQATVPPSERSQR